MGVTFDEVYRMALQLSAADRRRLADELAGTPSGLSAREMRQASAIEDPDLGLLIFDVGDWPEGLSLRRDDVSGGLLNAE
jgi:2-keto-4-pentenoate hydratase